LLEDLLDFARHEAGQPTRLEEKLFSLGDLGKQVAAFFDNDSQERGIDFSIKFIDLELSSLEPRVDRSASPRTFLASRRYDIAHTQNMHLWGDQHRILQIVINLISNGLKFTPAGGRVDLRIACIGEVISEPDRRSRGHIGQANGDNGPKSESASIVEITDHSRPDTPLSNKIRPSSPLVNGVKPGLKLDAKRRSLQATSPARRISLPPLSSRPYLFEFEVEDTGHGIPEEIQQRVFEPFIQGEIGLARKFGGAGLGLAICRQLATLMGGSISLKSTVGVGSIFTMRVPLR
jgi:osomolarity two-component system sensor histidine kinase SLN1